MDVRNLPDFVIVLKMISYNSRWYHCLQNVLNEKHSEDEITHSLHKFIKRLLLIIVFFVISVDENGFLLLSGNYYD